MSLEYEDKLIKLKSNEKKKIEIRNNIFVYHSGNGNDLCNE